MRKFLQSASAEVHAKRQAQKIDFYKVKSKTVSFLCLLFLLVSFSNVMAQSESVSGLVTDETNQPLPGVTIIVNGANKTLTTDNNGRFTISGISGLEKLTFSYIGFSSQEVLINKRSTIDVTLVSESKSLQDVVVVGYGVQNRRDVTGAVSTIKASELNHTNAVSIDNMIQGRAAGLNVTAGTSQPGGAVIVNIRGALSPRGDNSPLYVIDGLPITNNTSIDYNSSAGGMQGTISRSPLQNVNPNDIESVEILKDASATAIYGSAAANGVILITTKKGKAGETIINYNGSYGIQQPKDYLQPLNASEFRNAVNNLGTEFHKFNNKMAPYGNISPGPNYTPFFTSAQLTNAGEGTNYVDYILRDGQTLDQNISVSGGTEKTKIYTSFNYFDQKAVLRTSNFKRYAGRVNVDQKLGRVVKMNIGLSYSQVNNNNVPTGAGGDRESPSLIQSALQFAPDVSTFKPDGTPNVGYYARTANPASFFMLTNNNYTKRFILTPNFEIGILDGLKLNITGGIDNSTSEREFFVPVGANFTTITEGNAQKGFVKQNNYSAETYASYNKQFNDLVRFSGIAGVGFYNTFNDGFGLNAVGFNTDAFGVNNIGIAYNRNLSSVYSGRSERNKLSQFTRLNLTLADKYILQATGRFDAASNFPKANRVGFFPGISAGWLINQEGFLKDVSFINQLKLRAGYGTSGNESITANGNYGNSLYALTTNFSYLLGNQFYNTGFIQTQIGNPDLKWETDATTNLGLDFGLFSNRISGSMEYFVRTAKDLLDFRTLPSANPIGPQAFNVGSTRSKGLELTLKTQNFVGPKFSWESTFTFGTAKVYWLERNPAIVRAKYIGENDALNAVYGWKTDGLIRSASEIPAYQTGAFVGNTKFIDLNKDGKLDINDVTNLGDGTPKATFGLNNTIDFKGFDLTAFVYGSYGNITFDGYQNITNAGNLLRVGAPVNAERRSLDIYTSYNPNGTYPGLANNPISGNNPTGISDFRTVQNSYFARLKSVTLGYTLPSTILKSRFLKFARVFVDVQNLGHLTNIRGFDPEMERNNNPYPTALTTSFGITSTF
ncbi:MAG TPA: SusC/RagA family TonB-linked outer membrane protein [Pedobacter sp.]|jgi:TonB-linked SusC/RagA family outer membrane protein